MRLTELQELLRQQSNAAVLVSPQVLGNVIQQIHNLPTFLWSIPHRTSCVVDKQILFAHIEPDDLELTPDHLLPETVLLLQRPSNEELADWSQDEVLREYWRRLFHATTHLHLEKQWDQRVLTEEEIRKRISAIGRAEVEEAYSVLLEENYLTAKSSLKDRYIELAAVFLELYFFSANLIPTFFPSIHQIEPVKVILSENMNPKKIFEDTRLAGAPEPVLRTEYNSEEANDYYRRLIEVAKISSKRGNTVRAAILRTKAARVAPVDLTKEAQNAAGEEIDTLVTRLFDVMKSREDSSADLSPQAEPIQSTPAFHEWSNDLKTLLDKADQGSRPVEAGLLFDLQNACLDNEREIYTFNLMNSLSSAGRQSMTRPLPAQRHIRIIKHFRSATQRLTLARLSDGDRQHLGQLLQEALQQQEENLRKKYRPILETALEEVGLHAENPPERAASQKVIEEILDRVIEYGFLTFSDLRDTISRNQLKLPDITSPKDFVRGDALLRLDRRLATLLDGVYRPSEIYMRLLERLTSLNFGTQLGRAITLHVTLPLGGGFLMVEGTKLLWHSATSKSTPAASKEPGTENTSQESGVNSQETATTDAAGRAPDSWPVLPDPWPLILSLICAVLVAGGIHALLHRSAFRESCTRFLRRAGQGIRFLFVELPVLAAHWPALHAVFNSWPYQVFHWFLFKPLVISALLCPFYPYVSFWYYFAGVVVASILLINSKLGRTINALFNQTIQSFVDLLRAGLLRGLLHFFIWIFKQIVDAIESVLFTIDEWFRFRRGESKIDLVVRTVLGMIWFPLSYLARFYVVVLIEPGFNPIKAPVSYLAAKFMYPLFIQIGLVSLLTPHFEPVLGSHLAYAFVFSTVWLLPDVFGFLFGR